MPSEDRQHRHEQAAELARLFVQVAEDKPAVLDALLALMRALAPAPAPSSNAVDRSPLAPKGAAAPAAPSLVAEDSVVELPVVELPVVELPVVNLPVVNLPGPQSPRQHTPKDQASLQALLGKFGEVSATSGLGVPSKSSMQERTGFVLSGRWSDDVSEAKLLARLLRAQARRLKSLRLAMHAKAALPPVDHVLAGERIEDWTAVESTARALKPHDLKEGERWYTLAARASAAIGDWLEENPAAELGYGMTPESFRERLHCLARAQKGIYCWLQQLLGHRGRCAVQDRVMVTLKSWVARDYFAVYIPSGMQLSQRITSAERDEVERDLHRFDLEHAAHEEPEAAAPVAAPVAAVAQAPRAPLRSQASAFAPPDRFESVSDAFLAAKRAFAGDRIVFTERAEESAEDSAFKRPDEAYEFFAAMHEIALQLADGSLDGVPLGSVFAQHGFKSKRSSVSSMNRFHRFYHMPFDNAEVDLSLHVTLGSRNQNTCMSIHWWYDGAHRRFVVGHCGKHLPNSLT